MTRSKALHFMTAAVAIPLVALAVAGCGDDDQATGAARPPTTTGGGSGTIGVANAGSLGRILIDSSGRRRDRTGRHRSPTTAIRSTCSRATAAPAKLMARASARSAPAGTCSRRRAIR
jgi:hypothetical protein